MRRARATLELVNETVDQDLNLDALHDALAVLLVRYHAARGAQTTPTG